MRSAIFLALAASLGATACGEPVSDNHFANNLQAEPGAPDAVTIQAAPVRIGELGPNFGACASVGTTRHVEPGASLPVREAPFEAGAATGAVPAGARFFVCSRSHDQKWLGIVYDQAGDLSPSCGVSEPVTTRRAYDGPCRSGWVASAFVRLVAGLDQPPPPNQPASRSPQGAVTGADPSS